MRLPQYSMVGKEVITLSYPQLFLGPSLASRALKLTKFTILVLNCSQR